MPDTYTTAQLAQDIMNTVSSNAAPVVTASILLGVANFIIGWWMSSIGLLSKDPFKGR